MAFAKRQEIDLLVTLGKSRGYLTFSEVNDALPPDVLSADQIDDMMHVLEQLKIEVVESASKAKRIFDSDRETFTSSPVSSINLRSSATALRGTITPGMASAPEGIGISTLARRCPSVATALNKAVPSRSAQCR